MFRLLWRFGKSCEKLNFCFPAKTEPFYLLRSQCSKPKLFWKDAWFFSLNVWLISFQQSFKCRNWCWMSNNWTNSRYYKRSFLVICTTSRSTFHFGWRNQNIHSTLNSSFDTLSKWHEPDIRQMGVKNSNVHVFFNFTIIHPRF